MVFIMQCGHCERFAIMEDEWCGSEIECPLCGRPIHLDPMAPADPPAAAEEPKAPPRVTGRPKGPTP